MDFSPISVKSLLSAHRPFDLEAHMILPSPPASMESGFQSRPEKIWIGMGATEGFW